MPTEGSPKMDLANLSLRFTAGQISNFVRLASSSHKGTPFPLAGKMFSHAKSRKTEIPSHFDARGWLNRERLSACAPHPFFEKRKKRLAVRSGVARLSSLEGRRVSLERCII